jgi:hypothetical protein
MTDPSASLRQEIERPESLASIQRRLGIGAAAALEFQRLAARLQETEEENAKLQEAGNEIAVELHAAINEPMYAGTRKDWIDRAYAAESSLTTLQEALKPFMRRWMDNPQASTYLFTLVEAYEPELQGSSRRREMLEAVQSLEDALRSFSASGPAAQKEKPPPGPEQRYVMTGGKDRRKQFGTRT